MFCICFTIQVTPLRHTSVLMCFSSFLFSLSLQGTVTDSTSSLQIRHVTGSHGEVIWSSFRHQLNGVSIFFSCWVFFSPPPAGMCGRLTFS